MVHEHITSRAGGRTLTPPLEDIDHVRGELRRGRWSWSCSATSSAPSASAPSRSCAGCASGSATASLFAFRHLPIPERHPLAPLAAEASEAAAAQGRFWEYHDALFRPSRSSRARRCWRSAATSASTPSAWRPRSTPAPTAPRIARDLASAEASGATGTPTFFVNGERHFGAYDAGSLVEALEAGTATG